MSAKANILIVSPIDSDAVSSLSERYSVTSAVNSSSSQLRKLLPQADVLVCRSGVDLSGEQLMRASKLRLIVRAGSGTDNVDLDVAAKQGIEFRRIPEPGAQAVAELAFGLMLALARNILVVDRKLRQGRWTKHDLPGYLLHKKTLGVLGAGNIGSRVAEMGAAWGMEVIGCVQPDSPECEVRSIDQGIRIVSVEDVLRRADFLSIHVPLNQETQGMIGRTELRTMKSGAFLINLARGGVVDEAALFDVLEAEDGLAGAALDVHEVEGEGAVSPLASLPNVVLTPHIGAQTVDSQHEIGCRAVTIIDEFFKTQQNRHS